MDQEFELPVIFKGEQLVFKARLLKYVYTHKIQMYVFDQEILLEPDEERNYRIVSSEPSESTKRIDTDILKAIITAIESLGK